MMRQKLIETIRAVPISGRTYEEYVEAVADRLLAEGDIGTTKFVAKAVKERGTFIARSDIDKIYTKGVNDLAREITAIIESTLDHNPLTEYRRGYNDALNDLLKILKEYTE